MAIAGLKRRRWSGVGFPFVEDGEAFGVLGDLQQQGGERVCRAAVWRVHRVVIARGRG